MSLSDAELNAILFDLAKRYATVAWEPLGDQLVAIALYGSISRQLRAEREVCFYGDEQSGVPPESLYTREDAEEALSKAREVLNICHILIEPVEEDR